MVDRKVRPCPDSYPVGPGLHPVGVSQSLCGPLTRLVPPGRGVGVMDSLTPAATGASGTGGHSFLGFPGYLAGVGGWDSGQEVLGARHRHQGARLRYSWALTASVGITNQTCISAFQGWPRGAPEVEMTRVRREACPRPHCWESTARVGAKRPCVLSMRDFLRRPSPLPGTVGSTRQSLTATGPHICHSRSPACGRCNKRLWNE